MSCVAAHSTAAKSRCLPPVHSACMLEPIRGPPASPLTSSSVLVPGAPTAEPLGTSTLNPPSPPRGTSALMPTLMPLRPHLGISPLMVRPPRSSGSSNERPPPPSSRLEAKLRSPASSSRESDSSPPGPPAPDCCCKTAGQGGGQGSQTSMDTNAVPQAQQVAALTPYACPKAGGTYKSFIPGANNWPEAALLRGCPCPGLAAASGEECAAPYLDRPGRPRLLHLGSTRPPDSPRREAAGAQVALRQLQGQAAPAFRRRRRSSSHTARQGCQGRCHAFKRGQAPQRPAGQRWAAQWRQGGRARGGRRCGGRAWCRDGGLAGGGRVVCFRLRQRRLCRLPRLRTQQTATLR